MPTDIHHLGAENSDATFNIRVDFVKLGHDAANGRRFFYQIDLMTGIGYVKGALNARNPSTDDQRSVSDKNLLFILWVNPPTSRNRNFNNIFCFTSSCFSVFRHP